jgi:methylase of polypeptide subunit release factors
MMEFEIPNRPEFRVSYNSAEDGGGTWFGQEYVSQLQRYDRTFARCLEWCSGPGFIGFALLANHLCQDLTLIDRYAPSADSVTQTMQRNQCEDRVRFYNLDRIATLPGHERFDLVVANPPHYLQCPGNENYQRLAVDPDWNAHQEFYSHISHYLNPNALILMQENQAGSLNGPAEFLPMIERNGLEITGYWTSPRYFDRQGPTQIYYLEIRQKKS